MNLKNFKLSVQNTVSRMGNLLSIKEKDKIQNLAESIFNQANTIKQVDNSPEVLDENELKVAQNLLTKIISIVQMKGDPSSILNTNLSKGDSQPTSNNQPGLKIENPNTKEIEPVVYSNFTDVDNRTKEYLVNDETYQNYMQEFIALKTKMKCIENKYGMVITGKPSMDLREEFKITNRSDEENYSELKLDEKLFSTQLKSYEKIMANWQDGRTYDYFKRGIIEFHNIEQITLKNGQRAWKSDEGFYFPYRDGFIGGKKVPEELL